MYHPTLATKRFMPSIDRNTIARAGLLLAAAALLGAGAIRTTSAAAQPPELVSSSNAIAANSDTERCRLSADGDLVLFHSKADNLVPEAANAKWHLFLKTRSTGNLSLLSRATDAANNHSYNADLSRDGSVVVFSSAADNLVDSDFNGLADIFLRELNSGVVSRISRSFSGGNANGESICPAVSADGSFVAFISEAFNLIQGEEPLYSNVYVFDRQSENLERVSRATGGAEPNSHSWASCPAVSADGRYVVFASYATDIVVGGSSIDGRSDVYLFDRHVQSTELISLPPAGSSFPAGATARTLYPGSITDNGRYVLFGLDLNRNGHFDRIYLRDRELQSSQEICLTHAGNQAEGSCRQASISADGRFLVFESSAALLPGAPNGGSFRLDRQNGVLTLLSSAGQKPQMSSTGNFVCYQEPSGGVLQTYLVGIVTAEEPEPIDLCPEDPLKMAPGVCGCGIPDEDLNQNGLIDCLEDWINVPQQPRLRRLKKRPNVIRILLQEFSSARYEVQYWRMQRPRRPGRIKKRIVSRPRVPLRNLRPGRYQVRYQVIDESGAIAVRGPFSPLRRFKISEPK